MRLSILIPTYNRKEILAKCINALFNQSYPSCEYEIVIVSDGSTDGTGQMINRILHRAPIKIKYFEQSHRGPAAARNFAIKNSSGEIILLIGDDIIATPHLLQEHMNWHAMYPEKNVVVLGYVTWLPEIKITPFMNWLEKHGPQFAYRSIKNGTIDLIKDNKAAFWLFYTCNISIKKEFLIKNGLFDEEFPYAAYEDMDLGYRLKEKGLKIKYNKNAIGYHYHPNVNLNNYKKRMEIVGESAAIFFKKHPELPSHYNVYLNRAKGKKLSFLWALIYEGLYRLGLTRFLKSIQWRASPYYTQKLAEFFLDGYRKRKKILNG